MPLIEAGHIHFGENKIQEAEKKWIPIKNKFKHLKLHMVGSLQSNKAKKAVKLFDYIHSLDSYKLAEKINKFEIEQSKKTKIFIQINLDNNEIKKGIKKNELKNFYDFCTNKLSLNIIGLMCLPPKKKSSSSFFKILKDLADNLKLKELSMGMSSDYIDAVNYGATFLRIGTLIFGKRKN